MIIYHIIQELLENRKAGNTLQECIKWYANIYMANPGRHTIRRCQKWSTKLYMKTWAEGWSALVIYGIPNLTSSWAEWKAG